MSEDLEKSGKVVLAVALIVVVMAVYSVGRGIMQDVNDSDELPTNTRIYLYQKYRITLDDAQELISGENGLYSVIDTDGTIKCSIEYDDEMSKIEGDNYCAYKLDKEIQEYLTRRIGLPCKIIFDSKGYYLSPREQYSSCTKYLDSCEIADVFVYTTERDLSKCRASIVHDRLREIGMHGAFNLYVATVSEDDLDSIDASLDVQRTDIKDLAKIRDQRTYHDEEYENDVESEF